MTQVEIDQVEMARLLLQAFAKRAYEESMEEYNKYTKFQYAHFRLEQNRRKIEKAEWFLDRSER